METNYVTMNVSGSKIIISAMPVNDSSEYTIEFKSQKSYSSLFDYSYLERRFDGHYAQRTTYVDKSNGKVYVNVKFMRKKTLKEHYDVEINSAPWFKVILKSGDIQIAEDIFNQLTEQALAYESKVQEQVAL